MYTICYDTATGRAASIKRADGASIPIDPKNKDFRNFLEWNTNQETPLDYVTQIEVIPPKHAPTHEERILYLEDEVRKLKEKK